MFVMELLTCVCFATDGFLMVYVIVRACDGDVCAGQ